MDGLAIFNATTCTMYPCNSERLCCAITSSGSRSLIDLIFMMQSSEDRSNTRAVFGSRKETVEIWLQRLKHLTIWF